jgi:pyruvate formate lyase activating enzyme
MTRQTGAKRERGSVLEMDHGLLRSPVPGSQSPGLTRRGLLACAGAVATSTLLARRTADAAPQSVGATIDAEELPVREASWYKKLAEGRVECQLCPRACQVADQERGGCGVRENRSGTYYTLVHGVACSLHVDPIEKKPFFHVLPGRTALSFATAGCNVECKFCQNWEISQFRPEQVRAQYWPPEELAKLAHSNGAPVLSATYSEPVVFWEYVRDTALAGRKIGVRSAVVSNGFIQEKPLRDALPYLAAIKVDLKSFRESFYRDMVRGELKPVLRALEIIRASGTWLEIVVLQIPTMNDSEVETRDLARWIKSSLGPDVPVHITRFHPTYRLTDLPPTPVVTLERSYAIAHAEGLHFVYLGNVPGHAAESTYCPKCDACVIRRVGFQILENRLSRGACPDCKQPIPGVWS